MLSKPDMIEPPKTFLTSISTLTIDNTKNFMSILVDQAFAHILTSLDILLTQSSESMIMVYSLHHGYYSDKLFYSIIINTSVATCSTTGLGQFFVYSKIYDNIQIDKIKSHMFQFGIGFTMSIGVTVINISVGNIDFYIIEADILFILYLYNIKTLNIYLNNIYNLLVLTSI